MPSRNPSPQAAPDAGPAVPLSPAATLAAAIALAFAGGSVESFVYLAHGRVFTGAMTGNLVVTGVDALKHDYAHAVHSLVPVASFFAGLSGWQIFRSRQPRLAAAATLGAEALGLLVLSMLPASVPDAAFVAAAAILVAGQVVVLRKADGQSYSSTFITGDLRTLADRFADLLEPSTRPAGLRTVRDLGLVLLAFLAGALAGALLAPHLLNHTLWLPAAAVAAISFLLALRRF